MTMAKVLIVDDHPLVREGLAMRVAAQPDMEVCGEASGEDEALALLDDIEPDLLIVDLTLRSGSGLSLIKAVSRRDGRIRTLVVSAHDESLYAERALRAGALGYVSKQEAQDTVIDAIRRVLRGERYLSDEMTQRLIGQATGRGSVRNGVDGLSDRELEVFELIGHGTSTRGIAEQLGLSIHTIETHRENIRAKLGLGCGSELVQHAVQWVIESH